MLETIYLAIIAALPAISSIIGIIAAVVKIARDGKKTNKDLSDKFEVLAAELHDSKEMDEMKTQMRALLESNRALQKRYDELLTVLRVPSRSSSSVRARIDF